MQWVQKGTADAIDIHNNRLVTETRQLGNYCMKIWVHKELTGKN